MTDESNTGAPRGPLFVALDLADRIPAVRDACADLGVVLTGVDLSNGTRLTINLGDEMDADGFAFVERDSALELRMSVEAHCRVDKVPAPVRVVLSHLRAGVRALDALLSPSDAEVVDAEFSEEPPRTRAACRFNLNETIRVKLTDEGRKVLAQANAAELANLPDHFRLRRLPSNRTVDADGYLKTQVWDFAHVFGPRLFMGARDVCAMEVELERGFAASEEPAEAADVSNLRKHLAAADDRARAASREVVRLHDELDAARREVAVREQSSFDLTRMHALLAAGREIPFTAEALETEVAALQAALQGAREGRDAASSALVGLAQRAGVTLRGDESAGELADLAFEAADRVRKDAHEVRGALAYLGAQLNLADAMLSPREVVDTAVMKVREARGAPADLEALLGRMDEIRAALGLDERAYFGPVMERIKQVMQIATQVRDSIGYVDFDGVADTACADIDFAVKVGKKYDELAGALGCGLPADHANVRGKLEALQQREAAAFSALQKLRMALFVSTEAVTPAAIVDAALSRIERLGELQGLAARNAVEALRILGCPEHVGDVVGWAKLQAKKPTGPVVWLDPDHVVTLRRLVDHMDLRQHVIEAAAMAAGLDGKRRTAAASALLHLLRPATSDSVERFLEDLGDGAKTGRPEPKPAPKPGDVVRDARELPPGSIAVDCNGDTIVCRLDGSYGYPGERWWPAGTPGVSFAPYTIQRVGLRFRVESDPVQNAIKVDAPEAFMCCKRAMVSADNALPVSIGGFATSVIGVVMDRGAFALVLARDVQQHVTAGDLIEFIE